MTDTLNSQVQSDCGSEASDFELTDAQFTALIDTYLTSTREWISSYTRRTYTTNPSGLDQIIVEIACNMVRNKVIREADPIINDEDSTPNYVGRAVSSDLQLRLKPYIKRSKVRVFSSNVGPKYGC